MNGRLHPEILQGTHRREAFAEHDVYERGNGPPVVLIQELPGIGQETLRLADALVAAGYRVVLPHLFGPLGRTAPSANALRVLCMRREFHLFAANASSPIVDWLRALCRAVRDSYCIDESRIFSVGVSYGGIMSNTLGCDLGDVFRAIAPMAGSGPRLFGGRTCWCEFDGGHTVPSFASQAIWTFFSQF